MSFADLKVLTQRSDFSVRMTLLYYGFVFGLTQMAVFFLVEVYVTATFMGYFVVTLAWFLGVILGILIEKKITLKWSLVVSLWSYFLLYATLAYSNPAASVLFPVMILVAGISMSVGCYFSSLRSRINPSELFFWENNGFILGVPMGLVCFLALGHKFWMSLLVFQISLILILVYQKNAYQKPKFVPETQSSFSVLSGKSKALILFISGFNGILLQYLLVRQFAIVMGANELTLVLTSTLYFVGYSVGYFLSKKISMKLVRLLLVPYLLVQIGMIFYGQLLFSHMIASHIGFVALIMIFLLMIFVTSSLYSLFLPAIIGDDGNDSLPRHFIFDLSGALCASALLFFFFDQVSLHLVTLYFALLVFLILLLNSFEKKLIPLTAVGFVLIFYFVSQQDNIFEKTKKESFKIMGYENPKLIFSKNSFYHAIDVIDTHSDLAQTKPKKRISFLNGIRFFEAEYNSEGKFELDSTSLGEFTYFLAELPAKYLYQKLQRPLRVLILGGGSLSTMNRVSPYASKITLVEIDPVMVESSKQAWNEFNRHNELTNAEIIVDDAKDYLRKTGEEFDLIINDVSAPYYLGTMLMHSEELYTLVKQKINPVGLFAESTQSDLNLRSSRDSSMRILKGVANVFSQFRVVNGEDKPRGRHAYVYATEQLPLKTQDIVALMKQDLKYEGTSTYAKGSKKLRLLTETKAYSLGNMLSLLKDNFRRLKKKMKFSTIQ